MKALSNRACRSISIEVDFLAFYAIQPLSSNAFAREPYPETDMTTPTTPAVWPPEVTERDGIRLEPLTLAHEAGIAAAAADGELWNIRVTSVPEPQETRGYIETALKQRAEGSRLAFAVIDVAANDGKGKVSVQHQLSRHRSQHPSRRNRLDLVREKLPAQQGQHPVQTDADAARVRDTRLRGRWLARQPHEFRSRSAPSSDWAQNAMA